MEDYQNCDQKYLVGDDSPHDRARYRNRTLCLLSVCAAFAIGVILGILLPLVNDTSDIVRPKLVSVARKPVMDTNHRMNTLRDEGSARRGFEKPVLFVSEEGRRMLGDITGRNDKKVNFKELENRNVNADALLYDDIYWGPKIEEFLPKGYGNKSSKQWSAFIKKGTAIKMELGCGRMQNRLLTFEDGSQACVRYRQNTDQIQGELFSFYLAKLLNLTNLAPSAISVVDTNKKLWQNLAPEIAAAQWNLNRPVVMTKYIPSLDPAHIPEVFKPMDRHLNKYDVKNIITHKKASLLKKLSKETQKEEKEENFNEIADKINKSTLEKLVELAQWSDLIIFDYLTANLDRVVNNLYNFQWNINIMDAPAHNLAKKLDNNLLLFLDNESGMLHGYRLLKKYEVYHNMLLENLCVFRKSTVDSIAYYHEHQSKIGDILNSIFVKENTPDVLDVLPILPEKNVKILQERLAKIVEQVKKCQAIFSTDR